jgi:hypothetical protein
MYERVLLTLLHDILIWPLFFLDIWYICTSLLFNCLKERGEIVCSKKLSIRESGNEHTNSKKTQDMSQPIQEFDVDIMVAWICRAISHNLFVLNCIPKPSAASCQWHIILVACASSCKMIYSPSWNKKYSLKPQIYWEWCQIAKSPSDHSEAPVISTMTTTQYLNCPNYWQPNLNTWENIELHAPRS